MISVTTKDPAFEFNYAFNRTLMKNNFNHHQNHAYVFAIHSPIAYDPKKQTGRYSFYYNSPKPQTAKSVYQTPKQNDANGDPLQSLCLIKQPRIAQAS